MLSVFFSFPFDHYYYNFFLFGWRRWTDDGHHLCSEDFFFLPDVNYWLIFYLIPWYLIPFKFLLKFSWLIPGPFLTWGENMISRSWDDKPIDHSCISRQTPHSPFFLFLIIIILCCPCPLSPLCCVWFLTRNLDFLLLIFHLSLLPTVGPAHAHPNSQILTLSPDGPLNFKHWHLLRIE